MGLIHLHNHSEYSSLDGGSHIGDMPAKLKSLGMNAMALTDHGVMQGLPEFYTTLKDEGIKPILGLEAYLTDDRFDKTRGTPTWHLTLIAENTEGYHNLCKISSFAFIEGTILTFGRPRARADWDLLEQYHKGIICFTGCMAGPVMGSIFEGDIDAARAYTERLISIFGKENVYGEIQNVGITTGIPGDSQLAKKLNKTPLTIAEVEGQDRIEEGQVSLSQTEANRELAEICRDLDIPLVATGDTHYLNEDDADPHDAMICIGTGQIKNGPRRFSLLPKKYHMRSEDEMREALSEWPEAIDETQRIADRCEAEIVFGKELLPEFPIPDEFEGSSEYLRYLCESGMKERYDDGNTEAQERLDFELGVIDNMGFNDYFLIVWDLFNEARKRNIPAGPGRGSAAGSIVAYTLGITQLCPLEYKLLFERFLNPDRISMPDIDMDFSPLSREELIDYAREKYNGIAGCDTAVAQIVTFGKYQAKGAIKDAARVLQDVSPEGKQESLAIANRLSRMVPDVPGMNMTKALAENGGSNELATALKRGGKEAEIIQLAQWLEGLIRTNSIHAAAVLIASHDLSDDLPLQKFGKDKPLHVQYDMGYAEKLGLLKMDFLGLRNLDVIDDTVRRLKYTRGIEIDPYKIPLDDAKTYEMFAEGHSVGTFQFESSGMASALKEVRPTELNDLIALVALYRPGPMKNIPIYAARKNGREKTVYLDDRLEPILGETYAVTVYQEQSMLIARELAGFTPGQADDLRKAIGKKLRDKMDALKGPFMDGCAENGLSKAIAEELWDDNERAADYSFNKSHAACYALISYITGYLKRNYPEEYMTALLSSVVGVKDKPRIYLTEAKRMGLKVLPPDVNRSFADYMVFKDEDNPEKFEILFGLTAIKGIGKAVVDEIRAEREEHGPFKSVLDLLERMPSLNKTTVQNLIKAGALDSTGAPRKAMFDIVEDAIASFKKQRLEEHKAYIKAARESIKDTWKGFDQPKKKGIELAAKSVSDNRYVISREAVLEAMEEGIRKDFLRIARKSAREHVKEHGVAGIADEESSADDEKTIVEQTAQNTVASQESTIQDYIKEVSEYVFTALESALKVRNEDGGDALAAALAAETAIRVGKEEWSSTEKLNLERAMLGIYVTGHPLDQDESVWWHYLNQGTARGRELAQLSSDDIGKNVIVVGAVVGDTIKPMRRGGSFHITQLEDLSGTAEVMIFQDTLDGGLEALIETGNVVCIDAEVKEDTFKRDKKDEAADMAAIEGAEAHEHEDDDIPIKLIAARIYRWNAEKFQKFLDSKNDGKPQPIIIKLPHLDNQEFLVPALQELAEEFPGDSPVKLLVEDKSYKTSLSAEDGRELRKRISDIVAQLGPASKTVVVEEKGVPAT